MLRLEHSRREEGKTSAANENSDMMHRDKMDRS